MFYCDALAVTDKIDNTLPSVKIFAFRFHTKDCLLRSGGNINYTGDITHTPYKWTALAPTRIRIRNSYILSY